MPDTKLGAAFVEIRAKLDKLQQDLKQSRKMVEDSVEATENRLLQRGMFFRQLGKDITKFVSLPLALASAAALKLGSDAEQSEGRFLSVFGNLSNATTKWSQQLKDTVGVSEFTARRTASDFNLLAKTMGASEEQAADYSRRLTELALDLKAFNNTSLKNATAALASGIQGRGGALGGLGINVGGGKPKSTAELENLLASIFQQADLQKITGTAAEELGTFAGQIIKFRDALKDINTRFGKSFIPLMTGFLKVVNAILPIVEGLVKVFANTTIIKFFTAALIGFGIVIGPMIFTVGQLTIAFIGLKGILDKLGVSIGKLGAVSVATNVAAGATARRLALGGIAVGAGVAPPVFGGVTKIIAVLATIALVADILWSVFASLKMIDSQAQSTRASLRGAAGEQGFRRISTAALGDLATGGRGFSAAFGGATPVTAGNMRGGDTPPIGSKIDETNSLLRELRDLNTASPFAGPGFGGRMMR